MIESFDRIAKGSRSVENALSLRIKVDSVGVFPWLESRTTSSQVGGSLGLLCTCREKDETETPASCKFWAVYMF